MKVVFLAKIIDGCVCIVSIRKFEEETWFHFKRRDWLIRFHQDIVQLKISEKNFTSYKQFTINLTRTVNILAYYDAISDNFIFNGIPLEQGN